MFCSTRAHATLYRPSLFGPLVLLLGLVASCGFDEDTGDKVECVHNEDCEGTAVCINGTCATDISCVQRSDCPSGRTCINGSCVPETDTALDSGRDQAGDTPDVAEDPRADVRTDTEEDLPTEDVSVDLPVDLASDTPDASEDVATDLPAEDQADVQSDAMDAADAADVPSDLADAEDLGPDAPDLASDIPADLPPDVPVDVTPDLPVDVTLDVPAEPDLFDDFDVQDEDGEIVLVVDTFDDLPGIAAEGTRAYVTDLDEEFRYSASIGRWIYLWFYEMNPVVDARIDGDVTPANESPPWAQTLAGAGSISTAGGEVTFEGSAADTDLAYARFTHGFTGSSHFFMGEFSVANDRGVGFLRHAVDLRNAARGAVVNLENGENGIRLVDGGDHSIGEVSGTELADEPRLIEVFLMADDHAYLYVDHVLIQSVAYTLLPSVATAWYDIGIQRDTGGGTVTAQGAAFGRFSP